MDYKPKADPADRLKRWVDGAKSIRKIHQHQFDDNPRTAALLDNLGECG
jgi:hypothetical protein